jgi:hypothetical protein
MRMIVIHQATDLSALSARLLGGAAAGRDAGLQQLQRLNPHVDLKRIAPGTVLFVPDTPGFRRDETSSVSRHVVEAFRTQLGNALESTSARVREGHEALARDRQEVSAALKGAAVKRLVESDPDLAPQIESAMRVFRDDQQRAKQSEKQLQQLHEGALAELDALAKLLS